MVSGLIALLLMIMVGVVFEMRGTTKLLTSGREVCGEEAAVMINIDDVVMVLAACGLM